MIAAQVKILRDALVPVVRMCFLSWRCRARSPHSVMAEKLDPNAQEVVIPCDGVVPRCQIVTKSPEPVIHRLRRRIIDDRPVALGQLIQAVVLAGAVVVEGPVTVQAKVAAA